MAKVGVKHQSIKIIFVSYYTKHTEIILFKNTCTCICKFIIIINSVGSFPG